MPTQLEPHAIVDDATDAADCDLQTLAWVYPATEEAVHVVTTAPVNSGDGRSDWVWLRLRDGTLILGMFPQGDTYMEFSDAGCAPFGPLP